MPFRAQSGRSGRDRRPGGGSRLIGAVIAVVIGALFLFVVLPIGGLVVIGLGVYIGVLARRAPTVAGSSIHRTPRQDGEPLIDATPTSPAVRTFLGLTPSYGLSAALTVVGIVLFIGGIALFSAPNTPEGQIAAPNRAPMAPAASPSAAPAFAAPSPDSTPANRQAQLTQAPAEPAQPRSVATRPATREPVVPQPVGGQPDSPETADTPPAALPPAASDGGAVYYKNCAEARAAGAAPLHSGEPGYRAGLDSDHDGIACERSR